MSSSLRRGALAATALVLSIAPLSACAAGNDSQTMEINPDHAHKTVGDIAVQNATVITQPELDDEGPAALTAKIFNNGSSDQVLRAVTVDGKNTEVKLKPAKGSGPLVVPKGGSLTLGGEGNASAEIVGGHEAAKVGDAQKIVFDFSKTGDVALRVLVVPAKGDYAKWGPSPAPTTKPTETVKPTGKPGDKESGKPSDDESGDPTGKPGQDEQTPTGTPTGNAQDEQQGEQQGQQDAQDGAQGEEAPAGH
ncbi:DUF461 domain-containing protein [Streptomyces sp. 71268]|uniref:DUF461 domain-containing protein n=1 Tax=Streptomyces sp. 71268 TaxID=3002640 RepID=UPI0023F9491D|nr:DUF461 domain-containing protein [Streptomyces sp. 71268]WEV27083.1 DUF461 domain-containing protein [Streptomyces sp. 71268]